MKGLETTTKTLGKKSEHIEWSMTQCYTSIQKIPEN